MFHLIIKSDRFRPKERRNRWGHKSLITFVKALEWCCRLDNWENSATVMIPSMKSRQNLFSVPYYPFSKHFSPNWPSEIFKNILEEISPEWDAACLYHLIQKWNFPLKYGSISRNNIFRHFPLQNTKMFFPQLEEMFFFPSRKTKWPSGLM